MDNYKIRQDRPRMSSEEIAQRKDFDGVINDYQIIKKPFYKNPWFFGVTGMASVGLLIGATYSFTDRPAEPPLAFVTTENKAPKKETKTIYLASLESGTEMEQALVSKKIEIETLKKKEIHDKTSTLLNSNTQIKEIPTQTVPKKKIVPVKFEDEKFTGNSNALQNHPKINGKIGGTLSVKSLSKNKAITTDSKIPISSFEMQMVTEFGAKVFLSNSNLLTNEMVNALQAASPNTEVYFEEIKGQLTRDITKNLQPLKFSLVK